MSLKISINHQACNQCGDCLPACGGTVLKKEAERIVVNDLDLCSEIKHCLPKCPNAAMKITGEVKEKLAKNYCDGDEGDATSCELNFSELYNWPVKLRAVHPSAPYLEDADVLIAADCSAFVHGRFHQEILADKVLLTTCPKFMNDEEKEHFRNIIKKNQLQSVSVVELGVKCCATLHHEIANLLQEEQVEVPFQLFKLTKDGRMLDS